MAKYVNQELLVKNNVPLEFLDWFNKFYPAGTAMLGLISFSLTPVGFLYWIRDNLILDDQELETFLKRLEIVDSSDVFHCCQVTEGKNVTFSDRVFQSSYVCLSKDVSNSKDVQRSEEVTNSCQIFDSHFVDKSQQICMSSGIEESGNVVHSNSIFESYNIIDSFNILESRELRNCSDMTNSAFCADSSGLSNCLFCFGLKNASFHIFNKPVDEKRYNFFIKRYKSLLKQTMLSFIEEWPEDETGAINLSPSKNFKKYYADLPLSFISWIKSMPGYDPEILYSITMLPTFLSDLT